MLTSDTDYIRALYSHPVLSKEAHLCKSPVQFSGPNADEMRKCYAEFCSRHLKAVKLYKELLARDKRFQNFIRVSWNAL